MRKALIAVIVASVLFAVGAFAATFTVTSSDVASGTDDVGACAEEALVEFTTTTAIDDVNVTPPDFLITAVTVTFYNNGAPTDACDGADADIALENGDGDPATTAGNTWQDLPNVSVGGNQASFSVPAGTYIPVGPVEGVTVLANGDAVATSGP